MRVGAIVPGGREITAYAVQQHSFVQPNLGRRAVSSRREGLGVVAATPGSFVNELGPWGIHMAFPEHGSCQPENPTGGLFGPVCLLSSVEHLLIEAAAIAGPSQARLTLPCLVR